jgi:hypothetical protein
MDIRLGLIHFVIYIGIAGFFLLCTSSSYVFYSLPINLKLNEVGWECVHMGGHKNAYKIFIGYSEGNIIWMTYL